MKKSTKIDPPFVKPEPRPTGDACLVQIYPTGPEMGMRYPLTAVSLILGRDPVCDLPINNVYVSRCHARIQPEDDGFSVADLKSTNGTFVNEARVTSHRLSDGDYLRIGNCIFRYLTGGNVEAAYHEEIHRLTIMDALTNIHNQRYFLEQLDEELSRVARNGKPLGLVMFDIDRFKSINDRLGHLGGDFTLRELSACVKKSVQQADLLARYGGEEFSVLMPDTPLEQAVQVAERLRAAVESHAFRYESQAYSVTISLGVSAVQCSPVPTAAELIRLADENLYQAKNSGRNQVVG